MPADTRGFVFCNREGRVRRNEIFMYKNNAVCSTYMYSINLMECHSGRSHNMEFEWCQTRLFLESICWHHHGVVPNGTPRVILTPWNLESSCFLQSGVLLKITNFRRHHSVADRWVRCWWEPTCKIVTWNAVLTATHQQVYLSTHHIPQFVTNRINQLQDTSTNNSYHHPFLPQYL
jgi:hypothetical protein